MTSGMENLPSSNLSLDMRGEGSYWTSRKKPDTCPFEGRG